MLRLFRTIPASLLLFSSEGPPNLDTGLYRGHDIPMAKPRGDVDIRIKCCGDLIVFGPKIGRL